MKIVSRSEVIAKNSMWNFIGQVLPMLVAIFTIPPMLTAIGVERFGFLTIVWMLIGYAGVFDLGVSKAMTRIVSSELNKENIVAVKHLADIGLSWMLIFGLIVSLLLLSFASFIINGWLSLSPSLVKECYNSFLILSISIPFVMLTNGFVGLLQAHGKFYIFNLIKSIFGVLNYLVPLIVSFTQTKFEWLVLSVVITRIIANIVYGYIYKTQCKHIYRFSIPDKATTATIFNIGGWVACSNVVSPIMSYLDRLIVGGILPVNMMAYYSTPYDILTKLTSIPSSFLSALFPHAATFEKDSKLARETYINTVKIIYVIMFPIFFMIIFSAKPMLTLWLGLDFANKAILPLQIISIGLIVNMIAQAPATMVQSFGNPKWMTILHIIELPLFLSLLWVLTTKYGIAGTAFATALRFTVDAIMLFIIVEIKLIRTGMFFWKSSVLFILSISILSLSFNFGLELSLLTNLTLAVLGAFVIYFTFWRCLFSEGERDKTLKIYKSLFYKNRL